MAKNQTKAPKPAPSAEGATAKKKQNRPAHINTDEDLKKMGVKGNVCVVARKAFQLGVKNGLTGTDLAGKKYPAGTFYGKLKPSGVFWKVEEDGDAFKAVRAAAKSALNDLKAAKYTKSVSELINAVLALSSGKGSRTFSAASLDGISL